ncbi:MAG: Alpha/beta hydrolase fold-3 domain protein [Candidatus Uhrbacteria bacterium GW2011_GWF2_41_16]|uniref:Alpha/beta hydrolase fold-3 domain protein n=2 Tax=Candidatus Uhriibacteriota TaxID=1752732 RepID=A0A0G0VG57_9BACT|nr:MAG: Alpha/beta hydrolase fold-3 domain protein [Candidatus Uhrbacteria bacterium GW2011_GWA2_41_10]KKR87626.1 MAG: Alpha/beta hydrolase fold-3 domain protein [Candidatus Uhrbacteria bacterium GW2011_GWC2_41_11]KKR98606.1 MAG: Alpha/beta hydrolase fold-3 domain protein [Candidatus Uhrbacteria bacterium GW2011_GWF2_41_16]
MTKKYLIIPIILTICITAIVVKTLLNFMNKKLYSNGTGVQTSVQVVPSGNFLSPSPSCNLPPVPEDNEITLLTDILYNTVGEKNLLLDVAMPKDIPDGVSLPLVVVFHGGGFAIGDKSTGGGAAQRRAIKQLAEKGYVAISANYRLSRPGKNAYPAAVQDARCVIRWARINAAQYHIDPERVAVTGASAGGGLASSVAVLEDDAVYHGASLDAFDGFTCSADIGHSDKASSQVDGAVIYYGTSDFTIPLSSWGEVAPLIVNYLGEIPKENSSQAKDASPITWVSTSTPRILLLHGKADDTVPYDQSVRFLSVLHNQRVNANLVGLDGVGHSFLMFDADYLRKPEIDENLKKMPTCTGNESTGTTCKTELNEKTMIKIVNALLPTSCASMTFLEKLFENGK